ncbi:hypothetical protein U1Q18_030034 [Sarracenia purpurea var. burkii]
MSEIFPIHIKGIAGSLVVLVNWLGAWAVSYTFNFLMSWSSSGHINLHFTPTGFDKSFNSDQILCSFCSV